MARGKLHRGAVLLLLLAACYISLLEGMKRSEKLSLKKKVLEMFRHAYNSYMDHAYPADELMPLSCKGRYRGSEPGRGDIDDALGNFSLTLVDTLDTLAVLGDIEHFEEAVLLVIKDVRFDKDIVVSVFETNIRMLGGLLGGHVMAVHLKNTDQGLSWYNNELLDKAKDLGYRLLPAFNTTTGVPFPRVNLLHGIDKEISRTGYESDTCTACAGTMLLEFAALSRMTGETVFEDKAHKVMEVLWTQRHRNSDLVGTVINIHSGDWVRRESGVGAGIDSYYEYLLKGYILLGESTYLDRFNKHYSAIKRYVNQGPLLVDVHMHKPTTISRNFMDSLGAFWPGLQVLKGDLRAAIETHEMLYQVVKRHNFLPEAFTTDFRVHWAQHPLRPEFVESTYFLYKATSDPYYLEVGKKVMDNLEEYARVPCGYAAIKDVTTNQKEDQMDSYVMSETFKYLYLLFSEHGDLFIDVDDYVFTTEAHLLPLTLAMHNYSYNYTTQVELPLTSDLDFSLSDTSCPNDNLYPGNIASFAQKVRHPLRHLVESSCPKPGGKKQPKIHAQDFVAGNKAQLSILKEMGIRLATMTDGRVQLLHTASDAATTEDAEAGMVFMQEMIEFSKNQQQQVQQEPRFVQYLSAPYLGSETLSAGPAQFGTNLADVKGVRGYIELAEPLDGCHSIRNGATLAGKIVLLRRGNCMFVDKARNIESVGAIAGIVMDNHPGSTALQAPLFAMSGDGKSDVNIPMVFLFSVEGDKIMSALGELGALEVFLCSSPLKQGEDFDDQLAEHSTLKSPKGSSKTYTYQDAYYEFTKGNVNKIKGPPLPRQTCGNKVEALDALEGPGPTVVKHAEYLVFENNEFELRVQTRIDELNHVVIEEKKYILAPQGATKLRITFVVPLSEKRPDRLDVTGFYRQILVSLVSRTNLGALQNQGQYWAALVFLMEGIFASGKMNLLSSDYEYYMKELKHDLVLTDPADEKYVEVKVGEYVSERMAGGSILVYRETGSHMQIFKMDATQTQPKKRRNYATGQELDGAASTKRNDVISSKKQKRMYVDESKETTATSESHHVESSLGSIGVSVEQGGGSYKIDLRYHLDNIQAKKDHMKGIQKCQEHEKNKVIEGNLDNTEDKTEESGSKISQPADSGNHLTEQADRTKPKDEL